MDIPWPACSSADSAYDGRASNNTRANTTAKSHCAFILMLCLTTRKLAKFTNPKISVDYICAMKTKLIFWAYICLWALVNMIKCITGKKWNLIFSDKHYSH